MNSQRLRIAVRLLEAMLHGAPLADANALSSKAHKLADDLISLEKIKTSEEHQAKRGFI